MMRILKREYIQESLGQSNGDAKKLWRTIREIWSSSKSAFEITKIAEELNNHFVTIGPKLSAGFVNDTLSQTTNNDTDTGFQLSEIKYKDILKQLQELSPSKACGVDGITARLLKASGDAIITPLLQIFNSSIQKSIFPSIWKVARVTPRFKDGKHDLATNYRPISVLLIISKVLKRLIHNKMHEFVSDAGILNERQSGFRKRHSTGTCRIEFLDVIYNNIDEGRLVGYPRGPY